MLETFKGAGVIANVDEFVAARQNHNSPIRAGILSYVSIPRRKKFFK